MASAADDFVRGILDDSSPRDNNGDTNDRFARQSTAESMRTIGSGSGSDDALGTPKRAPKAGEAATPLSAYGAVDDVAGGSTAKGGVIGKAESMFRYSLIFINFTFVVASMLLTMAGIVARENQAVKLCQHCGEMTMVSIVFGALLWLFAMFGFNWIRQKNMLFLLAYVAFLLVLLVVLFGIVITAGVFDSNLRGDSRSGSDFLSTWEANVQNNATSTGYSAVCALQQQYNCSGFLYGCCKAYNESEPGATFCYGENGTVPSWVSKVCPVCPGEPAARVCTDIVYSTLRKNLGGFLVISCFSMLLVVLGIMLAVLSRKIVTNTPS